MTNKDKIRLLITEDEEFAAKEIESIITSHFPDMEIGGFTVSITQTVEWLLANPCDLIIMDINLADGNAFEIFNLVNIKIPVIFTTAYDSYAINAFKVNGVDYILKPYQTEDIVQAVNKFKEVYRSNQQLPVLTDKLLNVLKPKYLKRLSVKKGQNLVVYQESDIVYFFAESKYVCMVDRKGEASFVSYSMEELEQVLDPELFFRINRKYIVAISHINKMVLYDRYRIKIESVVASKDDMIVSIDRSLKFKKWINKL